ncbi:hypothetical protein T484DRAFT_1836763, partial [Baffinella frigidus]
IINNVVDKLAVRILSEAEMAERQARIVEAANETIQAEMAVEAANETIQVMGLFSSMFSRLWA